MISKLELNNHLKNALGFRTQRKIVVIESDDWGSIRTRSKSDYDAMVNKGLNLERNTYTMFDSLESNKDLGLLFDVLTSHKDSTQRHPVMTPMYIMANPDFKKIRENDFNKYFFEDFISTSKRYPNHDKLLDLIKLGNRERVFVPALHGREHLNAPRWMRLLQSGNEAILQSFKHESIGVSFYKNQRLPIYLDAFDPELPDDIDPLNKSLSDSVRLFKLLFGYAPEHFIEPNSFGTQDFELKLYEEGIKYLLRGKLTKYSKLHNEKGRPKLRYVGQKNKYGQTYLTRNCTFEPHRDGKSTDVVESCLNDIEIAFKWNKPALIISHRASYIGGIDVSNREFGLEKLDILLKQIIKKWPNVEFMTSMELGRLINENGE